MEESKVCWKCGETRPITEFNIGSSGGKRRGKCRYCCSKGGSALKNFWHKTNENSFRLDGETAYIELTDRDGNKIAEAIIDAADISCTIAFGRWKMAKRRHTNYVTMGKRTPEGMVQIYLHRFLMQPPDGLQVDHINKNGMDNRRDNLRIVTSAENMANATKGEQKPGESGVLGVCRNIRNGVLKGWTAHLTPRMNNGKRLYIGEFPTIEEATAAVEKAIAERQ